MREWGMAKDQLIADNILLRIKQIEDEREELYRNIGYATVKGEDATALINSVNTSDARIQELRGTLKFIDSL